MTKLSTLTYFTPFLIKQILLYLIVPVFYFSLYAKKVQWAYSDGGHLSDQVRKMELTGEANIYVFSDYTHELCINEDNTDMQHIFSYNFWKSLRTWSEPEEKPLAIQTTIKGYPTRINSSVVYLLIK